MSEFKSMRPYIWVQFPGLTGETTFFHSSEDGGKDKRFNYLTDFEFEFGTGSAEARFTLIDYELLITKSLAPLKEIKKKVEKDGGVDILYQKKRLTAVWKFGWHTDDHTENPWNGHPHNDVPDSSPPFSGIIKDISLSISEGIYKYDITVGGPTFLTYHCFIAGRNGKGSEKKVKGKNAYELVNEIAKRVQLEVVWQKEAREYAEKTKIEEEYDVGHKPVGVCINRILGTKARPPRSEKRAFRVVEDLQGKANGGIKLFIYLVDISPPGKSDICRKYHLKIDRDNLVLDFSPSMDKLHTRGTKVQSHSTKPDGLFSTTSTAEEFLEKNVFVANTTQVDTETDRASSTKTRDECRNMARQAHDVRNAFTGITAELTIVGDPGLQFMASPTPGWSKPKGRCVQVEFDRFPFIDGVFGNLAWNVDKPRDNRLSGPYFITRVSHKMGSSQPYTTTLSLKKTGDDEAKSMKYKDIDE